MYASSANSFGPIGMKLGMDTPRDPGNDMGQVRFSFAACALRYERSAQRVKEKKSYFFAFLCVLEHFESIQTGFFSKIYRASKAQNTREQDASARCIMSAREATENASAKHKAGGSKATENAKHEA